MKQDILRLRRLTKHQRERQVDPVVRAFKDIFSSRAIKRRLVGKRPPEKRIRIVRMDPNTSDEARRMFAWIVHMKWTLEGIRLMDGRRAYVDEAAGLITPWDIRKVEETTKFGIQNHYADQFGQFDESIRERAYNAFVEKHIFRLGSEGLARTAAGWLLFTVDPYREHSRKRSFAQWHDGWDVKTIPSDRLYRYASTDTGFEQAGWTQTLEREMARPRYWLQELEEIRFLSLTDQLTLLTKEIMTLPTGTKLVRRGGGHVYKIHVTPLGDPYPGCPGLGRERFLAALDRIRSRDYYQRPSATTTKRGAACRHNES